MGIYERLGVRTLINAAGDLTTLGGTLMEPEVVEAMADAARGFVRLQTLQEKAGEVIACHTHSEAGYITAGAGAGIALGIGACLAHGDPNRLLALPDTSGFPRRRVVLQACHRTQYWRLFGVSGASIALVEGQAELAWEVAVEDVAAVGFVHEQAESGVPFELVAETARTHHVPVLVDAAAALPPVENLWYYSDAGADLVTFSGGKALHGPQATGILAGRADLIQSVAHLHQGQYYRPRPFNGQAVGRPMKVGKEEIAGLVTALELYMRRDHAAECCRWEADMRLVADHLASISGVRAEYTFPLPNRRPLPCVLIHVDQQVSGRSAAEVLRAMEDGDPPVVLGDAEVDSRRLLVYPSNLRPGEAEVVADRLRQVFAKTIAGAGV